MSLPRTRGFSKPSSRQQAFERNPGRTFYNLNIDGGAMWMRKLIDKAIERETTPPLAVEDYCDQAVSG